MNSMKVVHLLFADDVRSGGGVIAMWRLHNALKASGVESKILTPARQSKSPDSVQYSLQPRIENLIAKFTRRLGFEDIHRISSFRLRDHPLIAGADVLQIHGIHGGFFSYLALPGLTDRVVTVFTLHDMWALTGHCTYARGCERWKTGCGKCPDLNMPVSVQRDSTALVWKLRNRTYARSKMTIVCPSRWITQLAEQSPLINRFPIHHVPHGIDPEMFRPIGREHARAVLNIPRDKKVVMFGAMTTDISDPEGYRKGPDLLLNALAGLPEPIRRETMLLTIGRKSDELGSASGMEAMSLGFVMDERLLAIAYSAADVFVFPTRTEVFGLVILESMACGTPVLSFEVGGVPDMVRPGVTGYLAKPENWAELRDLLVRLLQDDSLRQKLGEQCRDVVWKEYSSSLQAERHVEVYREAIRRKREALQAAVAAGVEKHIPI
jgi:glycosyltransferase involved in cell wall biosynthesis